MTGLEVALTLLFVLILVLILSAIVFVHWWRRKFRQEHSDAGSVTGHSTHSAASKEMMYFMCWENSSQVAALGMPVSPAGTNKGMPPAMIAPRKEPPALVGLDMHRAPRLSSPQPPPRARSPPVTPMRLPIQERADRPLPKTQAPARDVDQYKPATNPPGCNVSYKVYPDGNGTLFPNKDMLDDGERRRSSASNITAHSVFRQPSTELHFKTPTQSPPFYTPVSSPLHTTEGELSNLQTSYSLPNPKDVVERLYHKKVKFRDTPDHVKIMVGQ